MSDQKQYMGGTTTNVSNSIDNTYTTYTKNTSNDYYDNDSLVDVIDTNPYEKSDRRKGYLTLIGGVSLMLYLGCFFLWGNISIYVLSYFYEFNSNLSLGFVFSVDMFLVGFQCIGYNLGTFLLNRLRLHPKLVIFLGCGLALSGVYFSSFTKSLLPFFSLYCMLNGIGCGIGYLTPLVCSWEYFPEKKGLVTGIIVGAYGFGSFIFTIISTKLVNPTKADPTIETDYATFFDSSVADRVPYMLRTLVYIWCCFVFISICLVTRKPKDRVLQEEAARLERETKAQAD